MRRLIEERTGADKSNTFYKINPKVDDIPEIYGKENNGVRLLFWALKAGLYMKEDREVRYKKSVNILSLDPGLHSLMNCYDSERNAVSRQISDTLVT